MKNARIMLAAFAVLALAAFQGAAADTRTGIENFKHGRFAEALKELLPEAEQDDPAALYILGKMHSAGLGVPADQKKAVAYFKRGAELGDAASQNDYGAALALGDGVEQNITEAAKWLMIASRQGHRQAQQYVEQLTRYMSRSQVSSIRNRAMEWKAGRKDAEERADGEGKGASEGDPPNPDQGAAPPPTDGPGDMPKIDLPLPSGNP